MKHIKIYSILLIFAGLILSGSNALAQDFASQDDLDALQEDLDQNEADSDAADTDLQKAIDANADDITDLGTSINTEATARANADTALQADVNQNEADSDAADTALQADIDQNTDDIGELETADEQLQTNINTEATTRANADTQLQDNIDAEAGIRETMDTAIAGAIGLTAGEDGSYSYMPNTDTNYINEATSVIEATEQLDQALYNESQARISADNELRTSVERNQTDIETNRKGIAMVAAMTHTTLLPGNNKALDIGIGYFESESAYSINYAGRLNENVQVNFSAASTSGLKDSAVRCSLGFQW